MRDDGDYGINVIDFGDRQREASRKSTQDKRGSGVPKKRRNPSKKAPEKKKNRRPREPEDYERSRKPTKKQKKRPKKLSPAAKKLISVSTFFVVILGALLLGVFLFFKVSTIEIAGDTIYTNEQILAVCGYEEGDNLFFLSTTDKEIKLTKELPYISSAVIKRKIPGTLEITVTQAQTAASIQTGSQYVYVDSGGKILEISDTAAESSMRVSGLELNNPTVGEQIQESSTASSASSETSALESTSSELSSDLASQQETESTSVSSSTPGTVYTEIMQNLVELGVEDQMTSLDVSNVHDIVLVYQNRVEMKLGSAADLAYKLKFGVNIVTGYTVDSDGEAQADIGASEVGTLDLSNAKETNKASFLPDTTRTSIDPTVGATTSSDEEGTTDDTTENTGSQITYEQFASNAGRGSDIPDKPYTGESSGENDNDSASESSDGSSESDSGE